MSNLSISLNLANLKSAIREFKSAEGGTYKALVIPIQKNQMIEGAKGGVYINLIAFARKERKEGENSTHIIKQSFPKDTLEAMSDDEKKALPILGDLIDWATYGKAQADSAAANDEMVEGPEDDIPF